MSHDYRKYLVAQGLIGAGINFVLNGAIGWTLYRHLAYIPLYGQQSVAADIILTSLLLPVLVCLITTPLIRSEVRKARLPAASWLSLGSSRTAYVLRNLLLRALVLGVLSTLLVSPVTILTLHALRVEGLEFWTFLGFKASFAAALAALITPMVAAWALEDGLQTSRRRAILGRE
ncbi:MAG TPA: hypothetical protein VJ808_01755 [Gemmatimonadales bacterium]|nr:hypothetical protein [Gemmatimonadales bacterium]